MSRFAGEIFATCRAENNIIEGIPTSSRGDVAVFSVNNRVSIDQDRRRA